MTYDRGRHPGATWRKCDLQIHTPRDAQWSGSPNLPGGEPEFEEARQAWATSFVAECIARKLAAIAITDHHDFTFIPYVRAAIEKLPEGIEAPWLFPGVEVTCEDAVQCIVLFGPETNEVDWRHLFGKFRNLQPPNSDAHRAPQAVNCGRDIRDFIDEVTSDQTLRDKVIILPHASNEGAHKSMLRQGFHTRFQSLEFDGVYTDKAFSALDEKTKKIVYGKLRDWGTRRRGIIPTGDNRYADWRRLGTHSCWIRLGEPSTESVRQALLADEARLAYVAPVTPSHRVLELIVTSTLTGSDFSITFNDGFTALIGGRGSGKSTILEYLRFGLGRSSLDMDPKVEARARERELLEATLERGEVKVVLERDGVKETWHRDMDRRDVVIVKSEGLPDTELTILGAQERFRARAFYQKQLSTLVSSAKDAAEQITGIAAAEAVDQRHAVDQEIVAAKREIQAAFQGVVQFWMAESEYQKAQNSVLDLRRRLDATKLRLEESGLKPENQLLLEQAPTMNRAQALFREAEIQISTDIGKVAGTINSLQSLIPDPWNAVAGIEEADRYAVNVASAKSDMEQIILRARDVLVGLLQKQENLAVAFNQRMASFSARHEAASLEQANLSTLIADSQRLAGELQKAEARMRTAQAVLNERQSAPQRLADAKAILAAKRDEMRTVLNDAARRVDGMSRGIIRASVKSELCPSEYVKLLYELCDKVRIRDLQQKCEDLVLSVVSECGEDAWDNLISNLVHVYKHKVQNGVVDPGEDIAQIFRSNLAFPGSSKLTNTQVAEIFIRFDDALLARMLTATRECYIEFEYSDRGVYIPFEQASPGQQAAALLNLLLTQEAGTLIVDQPEDDLDNKIIMDIVRLAQTMKCRRQLIFSTHNANFVVNGDADKIVALVPGNVEANSGMVARIAVEVDGAIETKAVRLAITDTMEGGRTAFELRSRKYNFEQVG